MTIISNITGTSTGNTFISFLGIKEFSDRVVDTELTLRGRKPKVDTMETINMVLAARRCEVSGNSTFSTSVDDQISSIGGVVPAVCLNALSSIPMNGQTIVSTIRVRTELLKADKQYVDKLVSTGKFSDALIDLQQFATANGVALVPISFPNYVPGSFVVSTEEDLHGRHTYSGDIFKEYDPETKKFEASDLAKETSELTVDDIRLRTSNTNLRPGSVAAASSGIYPLLIEVNDNYLPSWTDVLFNGRHIIEFEDNLEFKLFIDEMHRYLLACIFATPTKVVENIHGSVRGPQIQAESPVYGVGSRSNIAAPVEHHSASQYHDPNILNPNLELRKPNPAFPGPQTNVVKGRKPRSRGGRINYADEQVNGLINLLSHLLYTRNII